MNKGYKEMKNLLEEQVDWCKQQDSILEKIEYKLYEMKKLAEYACDTELTTSEVSNLKEQLDKLKQEIEILEQQLQSNVN